MGRIAYPPEASSERIRNEQLERTTRLVRLLDEAVDLDRAGIEDNRLTQAILDAGALCAEWDFDVAQTIETS